MSSDPNDPGFAAGNPPPGDPYARGEPGHYPPPPKKAGGSGLTTILIVLGIGGVLACGGCVALGLLLPAVAKVRESAARQHTMNNLRQIALAAQIAHDQHQKLPPGIGKFANKDGTVLYHLLPFLEQKTAWDAGPVVAAGIVIPTYLSPLDSSAPNGKLGPSAGSNFAGNLNIFKTDGTITRIPSGFMPAGPANVVMFGTVAINCSDGAHTHSEPANPPLMGSSYPTFDGPHRKGVAAALGTRTVQVAMGDGSVLSISPSVTEGTWRMAMDPASLPPLPSDWGQ